jgi:homogentisate 1,2-dioxygenase
VENKFLSLNPDVKTVAGVSEFAPFPLPPKNQKVDFIDGLHTLLGSGDPDLREGIAQHVFMINQSMENRAYCNGDGDMLITAQLGDIDIQTEMGRLFLSAGEICVIPRGIRFSIRLPGDTTAARGYVTEIWGSRWELPDLGPIGGHGLANPRDFLYPVAHIDEDLHAKWTVVTKFNGTYNQFQQDHSPYDVVAWHGRYAPYKVQFPCRL